MNTSSGFETWARAATPRLVRLATLLTGDPDEGADVVQDVLVTAYEKWHRVSCADNPDAYVSRMVANRHLARRRSAGRRTRREHLVAVPESRPAPDVRIADRDALTRALADLGEKQRAIVLLRHVDGVSDTDIARSLGCSVGTVRSQASRGLAHLRVALTDRSPS